MYAVQRRSSAHGTAEAALTDAIDAVRRLDDWYSTELKALYREIDARSPAAESEVIAWHRGELAGMLADSAALVITGGHVGMLLRTLRLFALPISDELPVIAWSAGAMALTSKVVLFHDYAPQGSHEAEVYDRGLGRVPGVIALPHARRRLRLDDRARCAVLARRFPDHRLLLLDDGTSVRLRHRRRAGRGAGRHGIRAPAPRGSGADGRRRGAGGGRGMNERRMAINRLRDRLPVDSAAIDRFVGRHGSPIIEGERATFLFRGEADGVSVRHRVVGLPDPLRDAPHRGDRPLGHEHRAARGVARGVPARDCGAVSTTSASTTRSTPGWRTAPWGRARCARRSATGCPSGCTTTPRPGRASCVEDVMRSKALRRDQAVHLYLPARFNRAMRYPLLVVHDGTDYLGFAAMKTVLDNLIHRLDIAPMVVAFVPPRDRLKEYPNHAPHARFIARELVPRLAEGFPLLERSRGPLPHGQQLRRHRLAVDGRALPGHVRLAAAAVGLAGVHRHRDGARRRPLLRPRGEVRQPLPGPAHAGRSTASS